MTAKGKLFSKIDMLIGKARQTYYVQSLSEYMTGRGKAASASLASNPLVQLLQSMWMSSTLRKMTGGGGTTGKSALGQALLGTGPIPEGWTEKHRFDILMDVLMFRAFPSAVSFVAHMGLSALTDTMLRTEASKRWGKKVAMAFVAWHKATIVFLSAISEVAEDSPAKRKKASTLPNLSELTGYNAKRKAKKSSSRPVAPSSAASARAKEIAESLPAGKGKDAANAIAETLAKVDAMAPVK